MDTTTPIRRRTSTDRVRRHRARRKEGRRLVTVEIDGEHINTSLRRSLLQPADLANSWSVIQAWYASLLSDAALDWLIANSLIVPEQRGDAATILSRIGGRLERTWRL